MSVYAIADLHGHLPEIPRDAETVLIAGDICPDFNEPVIHRQRDWLDTVFREWLDVRPHGCEVVATWGNHDYVGEHESLVPELPWRLLVDAGTTLRDGRFVWGTPWVPNLRRWAFYGDQRRLQMSAALISENTDILMTHGPPLRYGDFIPGGTVKQVEKYGNYNGEHVGDSSLNEAIRRVRPEVTICGHIHEAVGPYYMPDDHKAYKHHKIINVAAVDVMYDLLPDPWWKI